MLKRSEIPPPIPGIRVPLAGFIGTGRCYDVWTGAPHCALGWLDDLERHLGVDFPFWESAYRMVAIAHYRRDPGHFAVALTNDREENPEIRRLLYHAAYCYLGYTEGMPPEAIALANKALAIADTYPDTENP